MDPDNDGWFEVDERVDYAQAVLDQWHKDNQGKDPEPGTRLFVVDTRPAQDDEV
jgi:hypothetical protein